MISIALATEDRLSEAVGLRLLAAAKFELSAGLLLRQNGAGYLRKRMRSWCSMAANGQPILLLTDLDRATCAPLLVKDWLGSQSAPADLLFRVAVREVEAWLLADHEAMERLFGKRARLPTNPDAVADPKQYLLELAKTASREVRQDLVVEQGSIAAQGIGYNARLCSVVSGTWSPERAARRSASLRRARLRIDELAKRHRL